MFESFKKRKNDVQASSKSTKPIEASPKTSPCNTANKPAPKKRKVITEVKLSAIAEAKLQQPPVPGKFCIKTASDGTYMFNLKAPNGEIIATSQMYTSKSSCMNGIQSVKTNAPEATVEDQTAEKYEICKNPKFELYTDKGGEYRFRLKATNGNIIVASQGYSTKSSCKNGIESVKINASNANIEEISE